MRHPSARICLFDGCEILEIEFYVFDLACFSDDFSHRFLFTAQDCFPDAGDENIVAGEIVELGVFVKGEGHYAPVDAVGAIALVAYS